MILCNIHHDDTKNRYISNIRNIPILCSYYNMKLTHIFYAFSKVKVNFVYLTLEPSLA